MRTVLLSLAVVALGSSAALAVPTLQLDAGGGYDFSTETILADLDDTPTEFTLYALLSDETFVGDTFIVSAAVVPVPEPVGDPEDHDLGSFTFNGTTVAVTADMTYGVPPMETLVAFDAGDLTKHGVYETYFVEFSFQFDASQTLNEYNAQDRAVNGDPIPTANDGAKLLYYQTFSVDTSDLNGEYVIHFDLYNTKILTSTGDTDVDLFAPFSHDAESVPEPSVLLLAGLGLVGLGLRRRRRQ